MIVKIKVVPNSSRDEVVGYLGERLKIKVKAQPEKGQANKAIQSLLAKRLSLPKSNVEIVSGHTNACKQVEIMGISQQDFVAKLKL